VHKNSFPLLMVALLIIYIFLKKMFPFVPSRIRISVAINTENRPLVIDDHVEVQNFKTITNPVRIMWKIPQITNILMKDVII